MFLLKKNAHRSALRMSTTEIGNALGMSQQNASRLLAGLEREGKIRRMETGILITGKGRAEIGELYAMLRQAIEGGGLEIKGRVMEGLGEGSYYVALKGYKKQFKKKLGFVPFAGTLNIKLDREGMEKRHLLREMEPIIIDGWRNGKRTYGDLFAYKCMINGIAGAIIIPNRTHHGLDVLEVIAPVSITKMLGKKKGDVLAITL